MNSKKKNWFKNQIIGLTYPNWNEDISTLIEDGKELSVGSVTGSSLSAIQTSLDGTKIYVAGWTNDDICQFSGSAFADVDTFSSDSKKLQCSAQESSLRGFCFSFDGLKCYVVGAGGTNTIYQYSGTIAWDISTFSFDNISYATGIGTAFDIGIKDDGTEIYYYANGVLYAYPLSIPNDLSSIGVLNYSANLGATNNVGLHINPNGKQILNCSSTTTIYNKTWDNSNKWVFNAAIISSSLYTISSSNVTNICVWSDASKLLRVDRITNKIIQYSFS